MRSISSQIKPDRSRLLGTLVLLFSCANAQIATAQDPLWWVGDSNQGWQNRGNWSTDPTANIEPTVAAWNSGALISGNNLIFNHPVATQGPNTEVLFLTTNANNAEFWNPNRMRFQNTWDMQIRRGDPASRLNLGGGGILKDGSGLVTLNAPIVLSANQSWTNDSTASDLLIEGNIALNSRELTIRGSGDTTVNGSFQAIPNPGGGSSSGILVKNGSGTLTLTGTNSFDGGTTINSGELNFAATSSLPSTGSIVVNSGGTINLGQQGNETISYGAPGQQMRLNGGTLFFGNGPVAGQNAQTDWNGDLVLDSTSSVTSIGGPFRPGQINGPISGTGGLMLSGWVGLAGAGSFTGETRLLNDGVYLRNGDALSGSTLNLDAADTGQLLIQGPTAVTLGGLAGSRDLSLLRFDESVPVALSVGGNNASTTYSGVLSGPGSVIKNGGGTLTLGGASANTFAGTMTVNSGTLVLDKVNTNNGSAIGQLILNPGAMVVSENEGQIRDQSRVEISGATWNMGAFDDTVGELLLSNGQIIGSAGSQLGRLNAAIDRKITSNGISSITTGRVFASDSITLDVASGELTVSAFIDDFNPAPGFNQVGSLIKEGPGTLTLSGANAYSGSTTVNAGVLRVGTQETLPGATDVVVNAGGTLDVAIFNQTVSTLSGTGGVTIGGGVLSIGNDNASSAFDGVIGGSGQLFKNGSGVFILRGGSPNTFGGTTTVNAGTLALDKVNTNVGSAVGALVVQPGAQIRSDNTGQIQDIASVELNSASWDMKTFDETAGPVTLNDSTIFGSGASQLGRLGPDSNRAISATGSSEITTARVFSVGQIPIHVEADSLLRIESTITDFDGAPNPPPAGVTISGPGTLRMDGPVPNTYTGSTVVDGGTLALGKDIDEDPVVAATYEYGAAVGDLTVNPGALARLEKKWQIRDSSRVVLNASNLDMVNHNESIREITLNTGTVDGVAGSDLGLLGATKRITSSGYSSINAERMFFDAGQLPINVTSGTLTINADMRNEAGTSGFTKQGAGTLTLTGANTYIGDTTVDAGVLRVGAQETLPDATGVVVNAGGTLDVAAFNETIGTLSGTGSVTIGSGVLSIGNDNDSSTFDGTISGTGHVFKNGTGTLTLTGMNTYTGSATVNAGMLRIGAQETLPGTVEVVLNGGALDIAGQNQTIGALSGAGGVTLGGGVLSVGNNNTDTTYSGVISGAGQLIKNGTGTLTLVGNQTYSGPTTINAGTLIVGTGSQPGSLNSDSLVTVASGATLGGLGPVGAVTSSGRVAPGNSPGRLLIDGDFTTLPGGVLEIEVGGLTPETEHDVVDASGVTTLGGALEFPLIDGFAPSLNDEITFINEGPTGGTVNLAVTPEAVFVPGLDALNNADLLTDPTGANDLAALVIGTASDVSLRFVDKGEISFTDAANQTADWFLGGGWSTGSVPTTIDETTVTGNFVGFGSQRVEVTGSGTTAEVHGLSVSDGVSEITVGVLSGNLLAATAGDVTIGDGGAIELLDGEVEVADTQQVAVNLGGLLSGRGTVAGDLRLGSGSGSAFAFSTAGAATGAGTASVATLAPGDTESGDTLGTLTVEGDYAQGMDGMLEIDISGAATSGLQDVLDITGEASLSGMLSLDLSGAAGQVTLGVPYEVLKYGSLSLVDSEFGAVSVGGADDLYAELEYGSTAASASFFDKGDLDGDGVIEDEELDIFAASLVATTDALVGEDAVCDGFCDSVFFLKLDFSGPGGLPDGRVDFADIPGLVAKLQQQGAPQQVAYSMVQNAYARALESPRVPEPSSAAILAAIVVGFSIPNARERMQF